MPIANKKIHLLHIINNYNKNYIKKFVNVNKINLFYFKKILYSKILLKI
jgi:hypothetical protein